MQEHQSDLIGKHDNGNYVLKNPIGQFHAVPEGKLMNILIKQDLPRPALIKIWEELFEDC